MTVEAMAAEGSVGPQLTSRCRRHAPRRLHEGPQGVGQLSGDLTVALPGVPALPLTGPAFEASIDSAH